MLAVAFAILVIIVTGYGSKKQLGAGWTLFFSLCFTPITGFIIALISPKSSAPIVYRKPNFLTQAISAVFLVAGIFTFYYLYDFFTQKRYGSDAMIEYNWMNLLLIGAMGLGFLGAALYASRLLNTPPDPTNKEISPRAKELSNKLRERLKNAEDETN